MIYVFFEHFGEKVLIEINGKQVWFSTTNFGPVKAPIDKLKINYKGAVKEFPDLENREDWKDEAIRRFKIKIESMQNEDQIARYLIEDLKKYSYIPLYKQKPGWRPEVIK